MSPYVVQPVEPKAVMFLLLIITWWLIRQKPEDSTSDEDGGTLTESLTDRPPHRPGPKRPNGPRRGPHSDPAPPAPSRVRTLRARSRFRERS